ncbi:competence type IV pilus minor pilin ComGG [Neobacillus drentensis]
MKNNEKGFTYPLTLCLLILFLLFFSGRVEQLLSGRKMAQETKIIQLEEYYFLSSVKKVEVIFQKSGTLPIKGTFKFGKGTMDYQSETPIGYSQKVNFTLQLNIGKVTANGRGYFDTRTKRLTKWLEFK